MNLDAPELPATAEPETEAPRGGPDTRRDALDTTLPRLVSRWARATPEETAVQAGRTKLTYADLDRASDRWAHRLRAAGAAPGTRVAVCLPRGVEVVCAVLGILKTGAAYVPLHGGLPARRTAQVTEDVGVTLAVTDPTTAAALPPSVTPLVAEDDDRSWEHPDVRPAGDDSHPSALAYVIFTSGSTGRPKGVGVTHRNVAAFVLDHRWDTSGAERHRVLFHSPYAFDASTFELWVPLTSGGTLVVAAPGEVDADTLRRHVREDGVRTVLLTTALFCLFAEEDPDCLVGLERIVTGGEEARLTAVSAVLAVAPDLLILNAYGPTETTTIATTAVLDHAALGQERAPLGGPMDHTTVRVLDTRLRPVPPGQPGELYISGAAVGRGYVNQPSLTAERFVADPFSAAGGRLYRTGDVVEPQPNGELRFRGRLDDQVKIRGFRVELAEVDAVLARCPGVAQVVSTVREDQPNRPRLVSYVVVQRGRPATEQEIHDFAAARLPDYMTPSAVVALPTMPLNRNGKIDRTALPAPRLTRSTAHVGPRDELEAALCHLWEELLGVDALGIHDDFFELGGDSLTAVRAVFRTRELTGTPVPVSVLTRDPTVAGFAAALTGAGTTTEPLTARGTDVAPLSATQRGLWFLHEFDPTAAEHNTQVAVTLSGPLHHGALRRAVHDLVSRHAALRTVVDDATGEAVQRVRPTEHVPVHLVDLSGRGPQQEQAWSALALAEAATPFDLRRGPLLRLVLVHAAPEEHRLLLTQHHITTDGWSARLLLEELLALYHSAVTGAPHGLPDPGVQYTDFAHWDELRREDLDLAPLIRWWRDEIGGVPPLDLVTDRPRPAVRTGSGAVRRTSLPADVVAQLRDLSEERRTTLFTTLLTAVQMLFATHARQREFVIGTARAGRDHPDLDRTLGFFVRQVPLRAVVPSDIPFADLLDRVRHSLVGAFSHDEVPFDRLVTELAPTRDLSRPPLLNAMVMLQQNIVDPCSAAGVDVRPLDLPRCSTQYDILVEFWPGSDGDLVVAVEYDDALFETATIDRLASHLRHLLESVAARPDLTVADLTVLTPDERQLVTRRWNHTAVPYPRERSLHQLFERQAVRSPEAPAVQFGSEVLNYRDLNRRANQLAHLLATRWDVTRGDHVAVCLPRTPELVVAVLAVLKSGAALVPLDPEHPSERLAHLTANAEATLVLTRTALLERLPRDRRRIALDTLDVSDEPSHDPGLPTSAGDTACVMYTSGSTGEPKGVVTTHRAFVRTFLGTDFVEFGPDHVSLSTAPVSWDAFHLELWSTLLHGGRCVLQPGPRPDPEVISELVAAYGVTTLWLSASLLNVMVDHHPHVFDSVRQVMTGGEPASPTHIAEILRRHPDLTLVNGYGPVESTVFATAHRITAADAERGRVPIGMPIANTRVYVLDPDRHPVPVGVPGELHIAGDGLAEGYLGRDDLTAERFTTAPFAPEERLYRTGDLGRWLDTGVLEILGRLDDQVKIRGFRVEPGEIEAALLAHPSVTAAAVTTTQTAGHRQLVAHAVVDGARPEPGGAGETGAAALRQFLTARLPDHLVPSAIVVLDELPLTPAGKLDRAALPAVAARRRDPGPGAPSDTVQRALARIWADLLGVETVAAEDNFFELGGDSILSMRVVARARAEGITLTSRDLFAHQTLARLALVARHRDDDAGPPAPEVGPVAPLTPIQQWYVNQRRPHPGHFNQVLSLRLTPDPDIDALRHALGAVIGHHEAFRIRVTEDGKGLVLAPPVDADVLQVVSSSTAHPEERTAIVRAETDRVGGAFDLATDVPVRASLIGGDGPVLTIGAHHLVVDGVSWRVLVDDLDTAYQQARRGEPVRLPAPTTTPRQWSTALAAYVAAGRLDDELAHWHAVHAAGMTPIPVDRDGENTVGTARVHRTVLDEDATTALLHDTAGAYRTQVNDLLLSALAGAVGRWTGESSVTVALEGHGREELVEGTDLTRTVGWFTSLFPVTVEVPDGGGFGALIKGVKETLRAVPRRGLGHGALRYLAPEHRPYPLIPARDPEISVNYLGQLDWRTSELVHDAAGGLSLHEHQDQPRPHLVDVVASVAGGRLEIAWHYSHAVHDESTIARVAQDALDTLRALIDHCRDPRTSGRTPSDFPLAGLDQADVDRIVDQRGDVEDLYPLTPMQAGMLFHGMRGDEGVYLAQVSFALGGVRDVDTLARAWRLVVNQVPVLRTAIVHRRDGEPLQVVHRDVTLPLETHDWSGSDPATRETALRELVDRDRAAGISVTQAPLARVALARVDDTTVQVLFTFHHLVLDGWSLFQLFGDVFATHAELAAGGDAGGVLRALAARPPYRAYVDWLARQDRDAATRHWRGVLAPVTTPTGLPYDAAPPGGAARSTGRTSTALSAAATMRLQEFARRERLTVNAVVQGAWALVLSLHSGTRTVCFGATTTNRPSELPDAESLCGLFINTLPVVVDVDPTRPIPAWLRDLQDQQARSRAHDHLSAAEVRRLSGVPSGRRLFDSVLVFENYPVDERTATGAGLTIDRLTANVETTELPLMVTVYQQRTLALNAAFDEEAFRTTTVDALLDRVVTLLTALGEGGGDHLVGRQPWLAPAEHRDLVVARNGTWRTREPLTLPDLLARAATAVEPSRVAIRTRSGEISREELTGRANRLARYLVDRGAGPEALVGVALPPGDLLVVALLAVLTSGAGYVPLDPSHPVGRVRSVLDSCSPTLLLTTADILLEWKEAELGTLPPVVALDTSSVVSALAEQDHTSLCDADRVAPLLPAHPAYVIFTSGSTGTPKGVTISHESLTDYLSWAGSAYPGGAGHAVVHSSIAFDLTVTSLFVPLVLGGSVEFADPTAPVPRERNGEEVAASLVKVTPSHLPLLVDPAAPPMRGEIVVGGEQLLGGSLAEWRRRNPQATVVNEYGPTEATVGTVEYRIGPDDPLPDGPVPIGRPRWNTSAYVLDSRLRPVPVGVTGELYLAGTGLARGYLDDPARTSHRFVANPFTAGQRMYRTGDLVRWNRDGDLEYLGRADDQVKIRGHRTELGEVEAALARHPSIASTAVVPVHADDGVWLAAYVIAKSGHRAPDTGDLRRVAARWLPEHALPRTVVPVPELPLTPNGKVDRAALPAPGRPEATTRYREPATPTEEIIARIWSETLGLGSVGADDSFFELGGDSIRALRVMQQVNRTFAVSVTPHDVLRAVTVSALALTVEDRVLSELERAATGGDQPGLRGE
ncbi:hypothetical protein C1701_17150 [Actinoalloteichus sp. AHMU CJ021]|uniref:non-ribosomal peptide synthetase n=1 Tax=Actinoalloteichus sp. AHMU CJ021 TaxID=2072503 RepID=UPI000CA031B7|nr:hypothetical protein C1701_17150 [Actinoalloteichus sp. AHMU CJ021]